MCDFGPVRVSIPARLRWLPSLASLSVLLLVAAPAQLLAQSALDWDDAARENWVRAPCDSREMPRRGYDIVEQLSSNDCYWRRDRDKVNDHQDMKGDAANPSEIRRDEDRGWLASGDRPALPEDLGGDALTPANQAFAWAGQKHHAVLVRINEQREAANRTYLQAFSNCGADIGCHSQAVARLQKTNQRLTEAARAADVEFQSDLDQIWAYYGHPDNPNP